MVVGWWSKNRKWRQSQYGHVSQLLWYLLSPFTNMLLGGKKKDHNEPTTSTRSEALNLSKIQRTY
jgi:hypothetical protein